MLLRFIFVFLSISLKASLIAGVDSDQFTDRWKLPGVMGGLFLTLQRGLGPVNNRSATYECQANYRTRLFHK